MENNKERKLGAGIITVSILHLIGFVFVILGMLVNVLAKDLIAAQLEAMGQTFTPMPAGQMAIRMILAAALALGVIIILLKKTLGVYIYLASVIASIIYNIIDVGFDMQILFNLILPVLMIIFIVQKKDIFEFPPKGFIKKEEL